MRIRHLSEFDDVVRMCLLDILGSSLIDKEWHQETLPVGAGWAGLQSAQKHAPAAYVSSIVSTELVSSICKSESVTHMPLTSAIELPNGETNSEDTVKSLNGAMQKSLSFKIDQRLSQLFIDSLTNDHKARFYSVLLQYIVDFLNTIHLQSLDSTSIKENLFLRLNSALACNSTLRMEHVLNA